MLAQTLSALPPNMSPALAGLLVIASFFTALLTATFGLGGGMAMLAILGNVLAPLAVVPVHGVVQLGSNLTRTAIYRRHIAWPLAAWFTLGAVAGGLIAIHIVVTLPRPVLMIVLGTFVLVSVLVTKTGGRPLGPHGQALNGFITSFATLFVGATGPMVAAFMPRAVMGRLQVVGTHGAMMALQHGLKIVLFGTIAGFAYGPWLALMAAMVVMGVAGNLTGKAVLQRMADKRFHLIFNLILAALALRMIVTGLAGIL
jgi:uncharacterized membrane protein YfcA